MNKEFNIPSEGKNSLTSTRSFASESTQNKAIDSLISKLKEKDRGTEIVEFENLDILLYFINSLLSISDETLWKVAFCLIHGLSSCVLSATDALNTESLTSNVLSQYRNSFKIYVWMLSECIKALEKKSLAKESQAKAVAVEKGKKRKRAADIVIWDEGKKEKALCSLLDVLGLDLPKLWLRGVIEENFLSLFINSAFTMFENSANCKSKPIKSCLFSVFRNRFIRTQLSSLISGIVYRFHNFDHLPTTFAELLSELQKDNTQVISAMFREIGRLSPKDLSRETMFAKCIAEFLSTLSDVCPFDVLPFIALVLPHLDGESHLVRNGIVSMIGTIILKVFPHEKQNTDEENNQVKEDEQEKENKEKLNAINDSTTRDQLFSILLQRFHDVNSFTRSKTIQTWVSLIQVGCVPLKYLTKLSELTVGRLKDKAAVVRKNAVELLLALLEHNPYSQKLSLSEFSKKLEECDSLLNEEAVSSQIPEEEEEKEKKVEDTKDDNEMKVEQEEEKANSSQINLENDTEEQPNWTQSPEIRFSQSLEGNNVQNENSNKQTVQQNLSTSERQTNILNVEQNANRIEILLKGTMYEGVGAPADDVLPRLARLRRWANDTTKFILLINSAIPNIISLFSSASATDVNQAIMFFVAAEQFGIEDAKFGLQQMLSLIWTKEASIKTVLVDAYKTLIFDSGKPIVVAKKLLNLWTLKNSISLSRAIAEFIKTDILKNDVIDALWNILTHDNNIVALHILSMICDSKPDVISNSEKLSLLYTFSLENYKTNITLSSITLDMLRKLRNSKSKDKDKDKDKDKNIAMQRLNDNHKLVQVAIEALLDDSIPPIQWTPLGIECVNFVYSIAMSPQKLLINVLQKRLEEVFQENNSRIPTAKLAKIFTIFGECLLKELIVIDDASNSIEKGDSQSQPKGRKSVTKNKKRQSAANANSTLESDLGTAQAAREHASDALVRNAERELLEDEDNSTTKLSKLVIMVCSNKNGNITDSALRNAAVLTLCKLMLVNQNFCGNNLPLLHHLLKTAPEPQIRSNIVITIGDLFFKYPQLVSDETSALYGCLKDTDFHVRKDTILVLSHLILNDMIKVKGQISDFVLALEDENKEISELVHSFFTEFASKGNALYNVLPDCISTLSSQSIPQEKFRNIMGFLFAFLQKDRQFETLLEKLCSRLKLSLDASHWHNISFCLTLLTYNDKCIRKLSDLFSSYYNKLGDQEVFDNFCSIISKAHKFARPEMKSALDELEKKVLDAHATLTGEGDDAEAKDRVIKDAQKKAPKKTSRRKPGQRGQQAKSQKKTDKKPAKKGKSRKKAPESEESEDSEVMLESDSDTDE